ncbi:MAG TPA: trypsin-like peptidase domain-containing protein, partial [Ktedonobacteraceae bacterium]
MEEYENSLVLISSPDEENQNFGTGFIIEQDGRDSYILTCAHVVRDTQNTARKVKVNNVIAEVDASGTPDGVDDLAVLRVEGLTGKPLLRRKRGKAGDSFISKGYQKAPFTTKEGNVVLSTITSQLQGMLGELDDQQILGHKSIGKLWRLNITDSSLPQPGYSGAPVVVNTQEGSRIIGVLSMHQGRYFFAIPIEVLDRIWPGPAYVPFTNRQDEIKLITSSLAPAYYLLDAPAGYGKSKLLQELQKRLYEQKWFSVYLVLDSPNLNKLAEAVVEKLPEQGL